MHTVSNFSISVIILVCVGVAFFCSVLCTMFLYVFCADMGLTLYGTKRIRVADELSDQGSPKFSRVTATAECQTLPPLPSTATVHCQTNSLTNGQGSAFKPVQSVQSPRPAKEKLTSSPVWAIPSEKAPPLEVKETAKKQGNKKKAKKKKNKQTNKQTKYNKSPLPDSTLRSGDNSVVFSTSAIHLDSFGSVNDAMMGSPPPHKRSYGLPPQSPPPIHSPDYLHVQLPNAPLSPNQDPVISYQVSYLPFGRQPRGPPSPASHLIRIPTATPPAELTPPATPTFRTTAWQESDVSSDSSAAAGRCRTPQPPSSFSSDSPPTVPGDPFMPGLPGRYNPTPPPNGLSPRGRGMLFTDAYDDDDSPSFSP